MKWWDDVVKALAGKGITVPADMAPPIPDPTVPPSQRKFTEEEVRAREAVAVEKAKESLRRETLATERRSGISKWFTELVKDGKALPAWMELGILTFMENLPQEVVFAEGEPPGDAIAWFKSFIESLPRTFGRKKIVPTGEYVEEFMHGPKHPTVVFTADERAAFRRAGITDEDALKFSGKSVDEIIKEHRDSGSNKGGDKK